MAWRGIRMIASGIGKNLSPLFINPAIGFNPLVSTWINSIEIDKDKDGEISELWIKLQNNSEYMHDFILTENNITLWKIDYFKCNGNFITVKDLYGFSKNTWCVFKKKNNCNSLMVVGTKTIKEQQLCGFTKKSKKHPNSASFCPLILHVIDKRYTIANSI